LSSLNIPSHLTLEHNGRRLAQTGSGYWLGPQSNLPGI
jgi:hypothetical protein